MEPERQRGRMVEGKVKEAMRTERLVRQRCDEDRLLEGRLGREQEWRPEMQVFLPFSCWHQILHSSLLVSLSLSLDYGSGAGVEPETMGSGEARKRRQLLETWRGQRPGRFLYSF